MIKQTDRKENKSTFATRLSTLMEERNVTVKDLAKILNISEQAVRNYKNDERKPDLECLVVIADHFKVSTDYLLGRTKTKTTDSNIQAIQNMLGLSEETISVLTKKIEYLRNLTGLEAAAAIERFNDIQRNRDDYLMGLDDENFAEYKLNFNLDYDDGEALGEALDFVPLSYVIDEIIKDDSKSGLLEELYDLIILVETDYPCGFTRYDDPYNVQLVRVLQAFMKWIEYKKEH